MYSARAPLRKQLPQVRLLEVHTLARVVAEHYLELVKANLGVAAAHKIGAHAPELPGPLLLIANEAHGPADR